MSSAFWNSPEMAMTNYNYENRRDKFKKKEVVDPKNSVILVDDSGPQSEKR